MTHQFDLDTFLHCPQGPRLEGEARAAACDALALAIKQGQVMTSAQLLMQDPSLITEKISADRSEKKPAVQMANDAGLHSLVLFALAHGMPVSDSAFGSPAARRAATSRGLLEEAVDRNSPHLVGYALLYRADPNQLNDNALSLLDTAILNVCSAAQESAPFVNALRIAHMLLDAGADPVAPGATNSAIYNLCKVKWNGNRELHRIFTEIIKRTKSFGNADKCSSLVEIALRAQNFNAAKMLIAAGAPFDAVDLNRILAEGGDTKQIPTFTAWIKQHPKPPAANAYPKQPVNLVPEGFLTRKECPRLIGAARADACRLLDMAITEIRFVTATKILSMDPSLIAEPLGEDGIVKQTAIEKALYLGMTALVPFALLQGMHVDDPAFGNSNGLLGKGIELSSPSIVSYALLNHADPSRLTTLALEVKTPPAALSYLDVVAMTARVSWATNADSATHLRLGTMLLDALRLDGKTALRLAAEAENIDKVTQLVKAGSNTDPAFLGDDRFTILDDKTKKSFSP